MVNTPPKFKGVVGPILKFSLVVGHDGELEDDSPVVFKSPKAVDKEKNAIKMDFNTGRQIFLRARKNDDDTFTIKINRSLVPRKKAKYAIKIGLSDEFGAK